VLPTRLHTIWSGSCCLAGNGVLTGSSALRPPCAAATWCGANQRCVGLTPASGMCCDNDRVDCNGMCCGTSQLCVDDRVHLAAAADPGLM